VTAARILALWSVPRARSTAFFRMMLERTDLISLHEPFAQLADFGDTIIGGQLIRTEAAAIDAIRLLAAGRRVFFKDTMDFRYPQVLADQRFLRETGHAMLIRHPRDVIASHFALNPELRCDDIGFTRLHELWTAIVAAGQPPPLVLDSDSLLAGPEATIRAYCARMRLEFRPETLTWAPGSRPEWERTRRWHTAASTSSGFEEAVNGAGHRHTVDNNELLAGYFRHHLPAYEYLYQRRLIV
jgi:hypothetical protein